MKTKLLLLAAILLLIVIGGFFWWNGSPSVSNKPIKVRMADLPVVHSLPLYYALEKGYFKHAGIEIERIKFEAPNQLIDAVMTGQVEMTSPTGALGITGVADHKNPGKVKIYIVTGGDEKVPNDAILVKNDSSIQSLADLKGKRLGILPGIQWRTISRHLLMKSGLDVDKDVALVELGPALQVPALASGEVDALLAIEPMPTIVKAKNIGKELVRAPTIEGIANPFYAGAGAVRVDFAKKHPEIVEKILEIFDRSLKEIQANPEAARLSLKGYTPLDDTLIAQAPILKFKLVRDLTETDKQAIQTFYDLFSTYGVVEGRMDFAHLVYTHSLP